MSEVPLNHLPPTEAVWLGRRTHTLDRTYQGDQERIACVQGYLAHKNTPPFGTLLQAYAWGPRGVLGGWVFSYWRGTPVAGTQREIQEMVSEVPAFCNMGRSRRDRSISRARQRSPFPCGVKDTRTAVMHSSRLNPSGPVWFDCSQHTGVPHLQENATPSDATVGLCLGTWGGPRGGGRFLMREVALGFLSAGF